LKKITRTAQVPFTAEQMYELVNNIETYPDFVHWCEQSKVLSKTETSLTATVTMAAGKFRHSFTTANEMQPGKNISVSLVEGPFRHLKGDWEFKPEKEDSCTVTVYMEFEFSNRLMRLAFEKIFSHIVDTLIDTFKQRAEQIYSN
jgi:ribosome-associated toxin RatA of RatAB toxin-antitoxin module